MPSIHHAAICVRDVDASLRFWRDGLGFEVLMDASFDGDWPSLLHAPASTLRSLFLGDPAHPDAGLVELVDLGAVPDPATGADDPARAGFLLLSLTVDVEATLTRLADLGVGGPPRRIEAYGVAMAVVHDPDGVTVELIDSPAAAGMEQLTATASSPDER